MFAVSMSPAILARTPVVVATAARKGNAPRRVSRAVAMKARGEARVIAKQGRRATQCKASESDADKTVSALDAILAGSQDEHEPEPEVPEPEAPRERKPGEVSDAMKAKMLNEYVGVGGTPSKPMPSNLFLNIILGISALAVLCKLGGVFG